MEGLLYVVLFIIWLLYVWGHVLGVDLAMQAFANQKPIPGLQPLHNLVGYVLLGLCLLTWFTGIGLLIAGWLGFLPAFVVYTVVSMASKH